MLLLSLEESASGTNLTVRASAGMSRGSHSQRISRFPNWTDLGDPLGVTVGSPIFGSLGLEAANHVLIVHPMEARKLMSFGSMWPTTEPTAT